MLWRNTPFGRCLATKSSMRGRSRQMVNWKGIARICLAMLAHSIVVVVYIACAALVRQAVKFVGDSNPHDHWLLVFEVVGYSTITILMIRHAWEEVRA